MVFFLFFFYPTSLIFLHFEDFSNLYKVFFSLFVFIFYKVLYLLARSLNRILRNKSYDVHFYVFLVLNLSYHSVFHYFYRDLLT